MIKRLMQYTTPTGEILMKQEIEDDKTGSSEFVAIVAMIIILIMFFSLQYLMINNLIEIDSRIAKPTAIAKDTNKESLPMKTFKCGAGKAIILDLLGEQMKQLKIKQKGWFK